MDWDVAAVKLAAASAEPVLVHPKLALYTSASSEYGKRHSDWPIVSHELGCVRTLATMPAHYKSQVGTCELAAPRVV